MTQLQQPIKFAYWVPNVSGGLVVSNIEQRTDWSYDYNVRLAQAAENNGFEYHFQNTNIFENYPRKNVRPPWNSSRWHPWSLRVPPIDATN